MKINKFHDDLSEKREQVVANKNRKIMRSVKKTENREKKDLRCGGTNSGTWTLGECHLNNEEEKI